MARKVKWKLVERNYPRWEWGQRPDGSNYMVKSDRWYSWYLEEDK